MTLREAIRYAEHPLALVDEVPAGRRERVLAKMDELFARAEAEQPLVWQAFRARAARHGFSDPLEIAYEWAARQGSRPQPAVLAAQVVRDAYATHSAPARP